VLPTDKRSNYKTTGNACYCFFLLIIISNS
jgi:hypothetical protein